MLRSLLHPQADIDHNTPSSSAPYSLILNRKNIAGLLDDKRYGKIVARQLNNLLKENQLPARDVQSILDEAGISNKGYSAIFRYVIVCPSLSNCKGS